MKLLFFISEVAVGVVKKGFVGRVVRFLCCAAIVIEPVVTNQSILVEHRSNAAQVAVKAAVLQAIVINLETIIACYTF